MEGKFSDYQKKQLEKLYLRLFEGTPGPDHIPPLTEEAKVLCSKAAIKPEDIVIRQYDEFKEKIKFEEVANIRYEHYQNKRYRK